MAFGLYASNCSHCVNYPEVIHSNSMEKFVSLLIQCCQRVSLIKYEPSLYFRQLCNSCMSVHAFSPSLRSKLFPRSSPNSNECMHERSKSTRALIHESQRFRNKADGLYLTTPIANIVSSDHTWFYFG